MVVSDHGYATLDFNVNMNVFLQKYGFQVKKSPRKIGLSALCSDYTDYFAGFKSKNQNR